jgi:predicted enzyme related to lactoylglutathione lyase
MEATMKATTESTRQATRQAATQTTRPKTGAVIFAKDVPRVARFYEAVLSMTATTLEGGDLVLESADLQLVIHTIPSRIAKTIAITTPPKLRTDTAMKPFFAVDCLADARTRAVAAGGALNPPRQEFETRGFRACDGHDPEGNVVQFRESAS